MNAKLGCTSRDDKALPQWRKTVFLSLTWLLSLHWQPLTCAFYLTFWGVFFTSGMFAEQEKCFVQLQSSKHICKTWPVQLQASIWWSPFNHLGVKCLAQGHISIACYRSGEWYLFPLATLPIQMKVSKRQPSGSELIPLTFRLYQPTCCLFACLFWWHVPLF